MNRKLKPRECVYDVSKESKLLPFRSEMET